MIIDINKYVTEVDYEVIPKDPEGATDEGDIYLELIYNSNLAPEITCEDFVKYKGRIYPVAGYTNQGEGENQIRRSILLCPKLRDKKNFIKEWVL